MRVGFATDHGGFALKEELLSHLREARYEAVDFGAFTQNPNGDYPDFVIPIAKALAERQVERVVAICGSDVGASVCANRFRVSVPHWSPITSPLGRVLRTITLTSFVWAAGQ